MSAFLHGKLPAHGDFVSRGLPPGKRDVLDAWLAESMAQARADLGDRFDAAWQQAPPWRFAWRDGNGWTAGALAASVDRVGRQYPLLLGTGHLTDDQVGSAVQAVEALLYEALAQGWDADRLHAAALTVEASAGEAWGSDEGWWTVDAEDLAAVRLGGAHPVGLMMAMLSKRHEDA